MRKKSFCKAALAQLFLHVKYHVINFDFLFITENPKHCIRSILGSSRK